MELDFENFDRIVQNVIQDRANLAEYKELLEHLSTADLSDVERRCVKIRLDAIESQSVSEIVTDSDYSGNSIYN